MPELPEVEFAAKKLRAAVLGNTIDFAQTLHPAIARSLTPAHCQRLRGRQIVEVARRAKIQLVTLDDGQTLEVHFRMTGDWTFGRTDDAGPAHERLRVTFVDGTRLSLTDPRALAVLRLHAPGQLRLPRLGPEPLDDDFTTDVFVAALAARRGPIKPTLLDQSVVAGVGNIYAAEALWVARVHPTRRASSLSRVRVHALHDAVILVLRAALGDRYYVRDGTSDATGARVASAHDPWRVYDRDGERCTRCHRTIRRITQAGRSTYYCGGCQR